MSTAPSPQKRRLLLIGVPVAVVVVVVVAAVAWWFLRDDAPDEVNLADATAQITDTTVAALTDTTVAPATDTTAAEVPSTPGDVSGTWNVDTTGTFVGFRVDEELAGLGSVTAVGRTPEVAGTLTIDGSSVTAVEITADMTSLTTDDSRRDNKMLNALSVDQFPTATFSLTEPIDLGDAASSGAPFAGTANGNLTIKGITKPVSMPIEAQVVNGAIVVVGSVEIVFADFDVSVPSAPIVLSAEDRGPLELQLFFTR